MIIDLSANNAHPINYAAVKAAGVTGVIVKATEGTDYENPYYHEDTDGFAAVGVPSIAYHFAAFTNAETEANYFRAVAGDRARVLDSETNADEAWQNAFLSFLGVQADQEMDYGSASTLPRGGIRGFLWPADYGETPGFGEAWQFSETGRVNGIAGDVDLSEWTGTSEQFDTLFGVSAPPPTPPPPSDQESIIMGLPTGCTDTGAINAYIRETFNTYSTVALTPDEQTIFRTFFQMPTTQVAWGTHGYGGNPDLLLAGIVAHVTAAKQLRPERSGSA